MPLMIDLITLGNWRQRKREGGPVWDPQMAAGFRGGGRLNVALKNTRKKSGKVAL